MLQPPTRQHAPAQHVGRVASRCSPATGSASGAGDWLAVGSCATVPRPRLRDDRGPYAVRPARCASYPRPSPPRPTARRRGAVGREGVPDRPGTPQRPSGRHDRGQESILQGALLGTAPPRLRRGAKPRRGAAIRLWASRALPRVRPRGGSAPTRSDSLVLVPPGPRIQGSDHDDPARRDHGRSDSRQARDQRGPPGRQPHGFQHRHGWVGPREAPGTVEGRSPQRDTLRADNAGLGSREAVTQDERCPPAPMGSDRTGPLYPRPRGRSRRPRTGSPSEYERSRALGRRQPSAR
jgi:hypothetical protein